jgi:hypothetical protein
MEERKRGFLIEKLFEIFRKIWREEMLKKVREVRDWIVSIALVGGVIVALFQVPTRVDIEKLPTRADIEKIKTDLGKTANDVASESVNKLIRVTTEERRNPGGGWHIACLIFQEAASKKGYVEYNPSVRRWITAKEWKEKDRLLVDQEVEVIRRIVNFEGSKSIQILTRIVLDELEGKGILQLKIETSKGKISLSSDEKIGIIIGYIGELLPTKKF